MCKGRKPEKTFKKQLSSAAELIDTCGFDCRLKVTGSDVLFKVNESVPDSEAFAISEGESFEFCGRAYVSSTGSSVLYGLLSDRI